jgi:hypothetical protein
MSTSTVESCLVMYAIGLLSYSEDDDELQDALVSSFRRVRDTIASAYAEASEEPWNRLHQKRFGELVTEAVETASLAREQAGIPHPELSTQARDERRNIAALGFMTAEPMFASLRQYVEDDPTYGKLRRGRPSSSADDPTVAALDAWAWRLGVIVALLERMGELER